MFGNKLITPNLSPNITSDDVALAKDLLFQPTQHNFSVLRDETMKALSELLRADQNSLLLLSSGRYALELALQSCNLERGDEVILQAFTCVAVSNPIKMANGTPVYVDIDPNTLNADISSITDRITNKTKVVIIQHTFGKPFDNWDELLELKKQHNFFIIEDCAHAFGVMKDGKSVGSWGDFAIYSFGRDKVISSVFGGLLRMNQSVSEQVRESVIETYESLTYPDSTWVRKQLLHPIITSLILETYHVLHIGKVIHHLSSALQITSRATTFEEKQGLEQPQWASTKMDDRLLVLLHHQLTKLEKMNDHRRKITSVYQGEGIDSVQKNNDNHRMWLRYGVLTENPERMQVFFNKKTIVLGDWYDKVVAPKDVNLDSAGYIMGSCPRAEEVSKHIINLPVTMRMTEEDAKRIVQLYKEYNSLYGN